MDDVWKTRILDGQPLKTMRRGTNVRKGACSVSETNLCPIDSAALCN